jgi:hypothetical protein
VPQQSRCRSAAQSQQGGSGGGVSPSDVMCLDFDGVLCDSEREVGSELELGLQLCFGGRGACTCNARNKELFSTARAGVH